MAVDVFAFTVTCSTGTTKASPQTATLAMPPRVVRRFHILLPPGPNGELGVALGQAGRRVYPYSGNDWLVTSDKEIAIDLADAIDTGAWQLFAYNTGTYPHTVQIWFECDLNNEPAGSSGTFHSTDQIQASTPAVTPTPAATPAVVVPPTPGQIAPMVAPKGATTAPDSVQYIPPDAP